MKFLLKIIVWGELLDWEKLRQDVNDLQEGKLSWEKFKSKWLVSLLQGWFLLSKEYKLRKFYKNIEDVEDILNGFWEYILEKRLERKLKQYKAQRGHIRNFMWIILQSLWIDYVRNRADIFIGSGTDIHVKESKDDIKAEIEEKELVEKILYELNRLQIKDRIIIKLRCGIDLAGDELEWLKDKTGKPLSVLVNALGGKKTAKFVGNLLEMSEGAVNTRFSRAVTNLHEKLKKKYGLKV